MADFRNGLHLIPEHMHHGITLWIEHGYVNLLGGFLRAVLSNDLVGAFSQADDKNAASMRGWVLFLYNYAPSLCYGSPERVAQWSYSHEELRKVMKEAKADDA